MTARDPEPLEALLAELGGRVETRLAQQSGRIDLEQERRSAADSALDARVAAVDKDLSARVSAVDAAICKRLSAVEATAAAHAIDLAALKSTAAERDTTSRRLAALGPYVVGLLALAAALLPYLLG